MSGPSYELKTLERGLRLLSAIVDEEPATLTSLSKSLGLNKTTALRTLRVLENHDIIRRDTASMTFHIGDRLLYMVSRVSDSRTVVAGLHRHLEDISRDLGVAVHLGIFRSPSVVVVDKVEPPDSIVRYSVLGSVMPLHCTGLGKAILADLPLEETEILLSDDLTRFTRATIIDVSRLKEEIKEISARGYAVDRGEYQKGFECVAVAIRFGSDRYAVSVSSARGTSHRVSAKARRLLELRSAFAQAEAPLVDRKLGNGNS